jgi:high-affinity nickel-transport protein
MSAFWNSLDAGQRRALAIMAVTVGLLHLVGFGLLFAVLAPAHAGAGAGGALSVGIGLTAYTLGMRHAFDADHICAIDNTTRKLIAERKRPLTVGFWFSLGHSSVVFALALLISIGVRQLNGPVKHQSSGLHQLTSAVGTLVSGGFLYLIAALNIVILIGIAKAFRDLRRGDYDEHELERQLNNRGLINRLLGRLTATIRTPARMYPVGLLFGLGFDTATEVALLVLAGGAAGAGLPWYAILCLPLLFAAGMTLLDSIDGALMHYAYDWALAKPVRKLFYNLTITSLSVAVAVVIATIEVAGLLATKLDWSGSFWSWFEHANINLLGLVIACLFIATWVIAVAVWRLARIEQRWDARSEPAPKSQVTGAP